MVRSISIAVLILASFAEIAFCGEIIVAREVESYFFPSPKEKAESEEGAFENTYVYDGNVITRIKVENKKRGETLTDNTKYIIEKKLANFSFSGDPFIRAVGFPGHDAIEILTFNKNYMQNVKSTGDYLIVTRYRITKRYQQ
jgi:hypothetical protein